MQSNNHQVIKKALDGNFDPRESIKRIERLMHQLKMKEDMRNKPNEYQHGMIDGLGNALTIILDEVKNQSPRVDAKQTTKPKDTREPEKSIPIIPWECWWDRGEQA